MTEYDSSHTLRGKCLVLVFGHFDPRINLPSRHSVDVDTKNIVEAFGSLDFEVEVHQDLNGKAFRRVLRAVSEEDHSKRDCLAVVIMSHGDFDEQARTQSVFAYDTKIPCEEIWLQFSCLSSPSLTGKPKLFFIQACRGHQVDGGVKLINRKRSENQGLPVFIDSCEHTPVSIYEPDMFIMWASFAGHYSFRTSLNGIHGSVFIFFLSQILKQKGSKLSFVSLMLEVSRKVALEYESTSSSVYLSAKKQVPMTESTLQKDLYFRPKGCK